MVAPQRGWLCETVLMAEAAAKEVAATEAAEDMSASMMTVMSALLLV